MVTPARDGRALPRSSPPLPSGGALTSCPEPWPRRDLERGEVGNVRGTVRSASLPRACARAGELDRHQAEISLGIVLSGFIAEPGNPLSRMTAASLGDLGYQVDLDAAEPYVLPNLLTLAEAGALVAHVAPIDVGIALPVIPMTRPPR